MTSVYAALLCSTLIGLTTLGPAYAQEAGAGPADAAEAGSQGDSGTSLADEARQWIGQKVMSADGTEIGTLRGVTDVVADSSEAGQLVVETADGSEVEVELQGAASDGETVTVVEPAADYEEEAD